MLRMLSEETRGNLNQIVQSAGSLQHRRRRNYRNDDEHHVDRHFAWLQTEDKHQDKDTQHAVDAQSDTTRPCPDKYQGKHNQ